MNLRNLALWAIIAILLVMLFQLFQRPPQRDPAQEITFTQLLSAVDQGKVTEVTIQGERVTGRYQDGKTFVTRTPPNDSILVPRLYDSGVDIKAEALDDNGPTLLNVLVSWFPMLLLIGVWVFFMRRMQSGGSGVMGFGKSKAKLLTERQGSVTFEDVAGVDEAKEELHSSGTGPGNS